MDRRLLSGLLALPFLFTGGTQDQTPPPTHGPMPGPTTKTYDVGGANRLEFTITFTDTGREGNVDIEEHCSNYCNGNKHYLHTQCDASCDSTCTRLHQRDVDPEWMFLDAQGRRQDHNQMTDVANGGQRFGANCPLDDVDWTIREDVRNLLNDPNGQYKHRIRFNHRHFNDKPCSSTARFFRGRIHDVSIQWRFYRDTEVDGKTIRTNGPSGTTPYGQVTIPEDKFEDANRERCRCSIITEDRDRGFIPGTSTGGGGTTTTGTTGATGTTGVTGGATTREIGFVPNTGLLLGPGFDGPPVNDKNQKTIGFGVTADGMTAGDAFCTNPFPTPFTLVIPPGTLLDTDDDGVQDMIILVLVLMEVSPATLSPGELGETRAKLRLGCLEMAKREPTTRAKFRILPNNDPVLSRLAAITNKSSFRGPWDQMRLWIYTDAATFKEISEKLLPSPGPGRYLACLREVAHAGADLANRRFAGCFAPSLLGTLDAKPADIRWFAMEASKRDPKGVAAWARGGFGRALSSEHIPTAAAVIAGLCESGSPGVQMAGLALLKKNPGVVNEDLAAAWSLAWSADKSIAAEARTLLEVLNPPGKDFYLRNGPK